MAALAAPCLSVPGRGGRCPLERAGSGSNTLRPALRWLERRPPPLIIAPRAEPCAVKYRLYVPDNVGDKVAGSWSRGETGKHRRLSHREGCPPHAPAALGGMPSIYSGPSPIPIPASRDTQGGSLRRRKKHHASRLGRRHGRWRTHRSSRKPT